MSSCSNARPCNIIPENEQCHFWNVRKCKSFSSPAFCGNQSSCKTPHQFLVHSPVFSVCWDTKYSQANPKCAAVCNNMESEHWWFTTSLLNEHTDPKKMTLDETAVCIVPLAGPSFLLCISCARSEDITECIRSRVAWAVLTLNGFFVITSELLPHQNKHKCQSELAYNGSKQCKPISPWVRNRFLMLSISHSLRDSKDHRQHWEWPWEKIWLMSYHQLTFQCEVIISFTSWKCLMHVISLRGYACPLPI